MSSSLPLNEAPIALVTGASRGIGRAAALALAASGWDVAVAARRLRDGEVHGTHGPQSGSLEAVATEIRALGRRALPLRLDLSDAESVRGCADALLAEPGWGRCDLLMNNALLLTGSSNAPILEVAEQDLRRQLDANVAAPFSLVQRLLPGMVERGRGVVVNVISGGALIDPPARVNEGGWSYPYAAEKSALHRLTGVLHVEHHGHGIRAYSLQPGVVATATMEYTWGEKMSVYEEQYGFVPEAVPAEAVAWLANAPEAEEFAGKAVFAEKLCKRHALVPGWPA